MRLAFAFGVAAAAALLAQPGFAQERAPVGAGAASVAPPAKPQAAAAPAKPTGPAKLSPAEEKARKEAEARERRREQRMLQVTSSICRGC